MITLILGVLLRNWKGASSIFMIKGRNDFLFLKIHSTKKRVTEFNRKDF